MTYSNCYQGRFITAEGTMGNIPRYSNKKAALAAAREIAKNNCLDGSSVGFIVYDNDGTVLESRVYKNNGKYSFRNERYD